MSVQLKLKPKIGVDARPLSYGLTGNSRYLAEVLKFLSRTTTFSYHLFSNRPIDPIFYDIFEGNLIKITDNKYFNGFFWFHFYLKKLLDSKQVDMFWGTLQLLPYQIIDIPLFVNYHDLNFYKYPQTMTKLNYFQHRFFSVLTLSRADKIFCLSESTAKDIIEFKPDCQDKLEVVYPGVSSSVKKIEKQLILPKNFFLVVATIEPRKNLQTVIEAYLNIKKRETNFPLKFIIAGKKGWKERKLYRNLFSQKWKSLGIEFFENPEDNVLENLYQECSFFVFPSVHEGFGLPILEAKKYNKLCIVSDIPVFHEIIDQEDMVVDCYNQKGWEDAILKLFRENRKSRIHKFDVKKWTWKKSARNIEKHFISTWEKKKLSIKNPYEVE